ncbi:MAG: nucleotidyl transferase AbiEii/AbiGii toxin family protein [Spirochaetia bacterium]|jgi:predicted nucleotidyltransferase component of viral defense system|nr:nucleotidyl transferase AbiEii/AbiGii toxin family protein [Spirochaetia bacterium]
MTSAVATMLKKYKCKDVVDYRNALKEIIQEIALCGLSRTDFFDGSAFYGGSALRIFYGLDRFSEDLDFSLKKSDGTFDLTRYFSSIEDELTANGFTMTVESKQKTKSSAVTSAFIKGTTSIQILNIIPSEVPISGIAPNEKLKIKFEIDTDPPDGASYENKYTLLPSSHSVCLYDAPSLFAGKIHALLCRGWQNRVKGRDYYDFIWYLSQGIPVNLFHLQCRLIQTGQLDWKDSFGLLDLKHMLREKFEKVDFKQAVEDVRPFVKDQNQFSIWGQEFFTSIIDKLTVV